MKDDFEGFHRLLFNLAVGLGTFIQILDSSIANVAIPYIAGNLGVSTDTGTWVITSFAASNAIVLPLTGWLSDYFGSTRLFVVSVLLFALTSFLCGISHTLPMLVFFRVLQGAVAGSLIPLSQTLLLQNNPPEKHGSVLGFWVMIVVVAPILGPIIGGYLTETYTWPWIFYINVPIGIFSGLVTWYYLGNKKPIIVRNPIDWVGLSLLVIGVGCLQIMLDKGEDLDWFSSNFILILLIISTLSLIYFSVWNYYQKYPIVDFSFFKNRNFSVGSFAITLGYFIYFGSAVTLPLWLQTQQHYTAFWAGLAVAPVGLVPFFMAPIVGTYMKYIDLRLIVSLSFILLGLAFHYQSTFTSEVDLNVIVFARFLQGFGICIFFLPLVQLALADIPPAKYASATGLYNFIRILVGGGFGVSISIELWNKFATYHRSYLSESITNYRYNVNYFYTLGQLQGVPDEAMSRLINTQIEQQAYLLSTNDLSWIGGWLFFCMIPLLFLCKPVKGTSSAVVID